MRLPTSTLLLGISITASCGPSAPAGTAATDSGSTGDASGTTGDASGTTRSSGSSGGGSSGGGSSGVPPADPCQDPLPAPTSCESAPEACGGATPIAWAPDGTVQGTALTERDVWFLAFRASCPAGLYRVSKRGGDAEWVRSAVDVVDFEADDHALYLVERTPDPTTMKLIARVDGDETALGVTQGDPRVNTYFGTTLTRTYAGVVPYWPDTGGPGFSHLSPTTLTPLGTAKDGAWLGSAPAYDGERVFFTWSDDPFDGDGGPLLRKLVAFSGDAWTDLADNAAAREQTTVAVDATHVYFATGDPTKLDDFQELPMNVSRIAKSGGPVTPLFPAQNVYVDAVLLDDSDVYFGQAPHDIFAVPKEGGAPRHVWHGYERGRLHLDASDLYFSVRGAEDEIPKLGTTFIVRLSKDTTLP